MTCGLYCITNKINGKKYFGQSINIERRKKEYFDYNKFHNDHLKNAFNKYGKENFKFEIIKVYKEKYLDRFEKLYIRIYDTQNPDKGYNKESGGNLNKHLSDETRQKISEANKGQIPWREGSPLPKETKQKISKSLRGKNKKDYPRIILGGKQNGKQKYQIKYNGEFFAQSIYKERLYKKWYDKHPDIELIDETPDIELIDKTPKDKNLSEESHKDMNYKGENNPNSKYKKLWWNISITYYDKNTMFFKNPSGKRPKKVFKVKYHGYRLPIGGFYDFITTDLIGELINEFVE